MTRRGRIPAFVLAVGAIVAVVCCSTAGVMPAVLVVVSVVAAVGTGMWARWTP